MLNNKFFAFLKLIRIQNLVIITVTQICIKYLIFSPVSEFSGFTPLLFSLSLISTILIASAGYIINDYFDVKTDKINRPNEVIVDVVIKRRWAMILHIIFNFFGLAIGVYLAVKCHNLLLTLFQFISITLLWFYSTNFKKQLLIGNIVVSLLTATVTIMPIVYDFYFSGEISPLVRLLIGNLINTLVVVTIGYGAFAFLTSFAREIIKDMEDYNGDVQTGCKTMPIVWGMITSKVVAFFILLITIGILLLACLKFYKEQQFIAVYYIIALVIIPLVFLIIKTIKAKTSNDFKTASILLKIIMLTGIGFTFILKHLYE
jgi:4-hydroxybenzoate polyprenyltransferase